MGVVSAHVSRTAAPRPSDVRACILTRPQYVTSATSVKAAGPKTRPQPPFRSVFGGSTITIDRTPVQTYWIETYNHLSSKAESSHDSQSVAFAILNLYDSLNPAERSSIHSLLTEWLLANDNRMRYDAAFLIGNRRIHELVPAVTQSLLKCESQVGPEAHFEAEKLKRILGELSHT